MKKSANQTINGKAFEYALLKSFDESLKTITSVSILENNIYSTALQCFQGLPEKEQVKFEKAADSASKFLLEIEPRLSNSLNENDNLQLEIVSDKAGQHGDVRDLLAIRSLQKWEIGISAKNNHRAVKHSRLSNEIDFGEKWLGMPCCKEYFDEISHIFNQLSKIRDSSGATQKWSSLGDYHTTVYLPVLEAFTKELIRLEKINPEMVAKRLIEYLVGNKDFYKVIKGVKRVEIQAYNLYGTLSSAFETIKPKNKVTKVKLPNRLIEVVYQENSKTTLLVTLNEGWQISFRIHNASSRVEPSLKFDINLVSTPQTLFTTTLFL